MQQKLPLTSDALAQDYRDKGFWKDITIAQCFFDAAKKAGNKTALIYQDTHISYDGLVEKVKAIAANFVRLGLKPGDMVAGQLPNSVEIPLLHLACNTVGLLYMPLHDSWREGELSHLLKLADVKVVITPAIYREFNHAEMFIELAKDLPSVRAIFCLDGGDTNDFVLDENTSVVDRTMPFSLLLSTDNNQQNNLDVQAYATDPDLPAAIMLSGGTTAISKISRFSSNNLLAMLVPAAKAARFTSADVALAIAPAGTGATGYIYPILMPLLNGATTVILPRWGDPSIVIKLIEQYQVTYAVGIPAQLTKLVTVLEAAQAALPKSLRCFANAGAPLPLITAEKIETLLGCRVQSIYGSTDGGVPTMTNLDDSDIKRLTTVGRAVEYAELEIWDEQGKALAQGKNGEIVWRCADKSWGYLGADDQTATVFTENGFYKSGDLGCIDEEGYLKITGRIKDMILRGGRNISPQTIELALIKHEAVMDVAVAAMPDPVLGERACAFVILNPDASLDFEQVVDFLKAQDLAIWQLPEHLMIVDDFPKGAGGKVKKAELTVLVTPSPLNN